MIGYYLTKYSWDCENHLPESATLSLWVLVSRAESEAEASERATQSRCDGWFSRLGFAVGSLCDVWAMRWGFAVVSEQVLLAYWPARPLTYSPLPTSHSLLPTPYFPLPTSSQHNPQSQVHPRCRSPERRCPRVDGARWVLRVG